jgi:hypothetical protein
VVPVSLKCTHRGSRSGGRQTCKGCRTGSTRHRVQSAWCCRCQAGRRTGVEAGSAQRRHTPITSGCSGGRSSSNSSYCSSSAGSSRCCSNRGGSSGGTNRSPSTVPAAATNHGPDRRPVVRQRTVPGTNQWHFVVLHLSASCPDACTRRWVSWGGGCGIRQRPAGGGRAAVVQRPQHAAHRHGSAGRRCRVAAQHEAAACTVLHAAAGRSAAAHVLHQDAQLVAIARHLTRRLLGALDGVQDDLEQVLLVSQRLWRRGGRPVGGRAAARRGGVVCRELRGHAVQFNLAASTVTRKVEAHP